MTQAASDSLWSPLRQPAFRGLWTGHSPVVLRPGSTKEVSEILKIANETSTPIVPQGGNTSMVGGATPPPDCSALILSLRRMNRLRSIDSVFDAYRVTPTG